MPNYCLCSIFCFFCLSTKRTQSISEKPSVWSTLKLLRKKVWFSFSFFLFHCLITLIGFHCVANLAILTHFKDRKEMYGSYKACFPVVPAFQRFSCFPVFFSCSLRFVLFFLLFSSKNFEFSGVFLHRVPTDPGKPWKPWKINQFYQSQKSQGNNLPVIITPLKTYLYGKTNFWMEVICLQHLLIEYFEKYIILKIANANSIFVDMKSIIQLSRWHFFAVVK